MKLPTDFHSVLRFFRYGNALRPGRDWLLLLSSAFVLIALSVAWNLWLLAQVERGQVLQQSSKAPAVDTAPLEAVRAVFEARKKEELRYRQEYKFVDPSVPGS